MVIKKLLFTIICFFFFPGFLCAQNSIELKYPLVLVHGIARNDSNKRNNPWGRIPDVLQESGIAVYFGNTDAWGSISSNAGLLKATIDVILEETGCEKVNIIAHSKGGIDSRYCIWLYGYGDRVASLTTISTPHQGAEVADLFFNTRILHTKTMKRRLNIIGKLTGDINPDIYNVNYELTTENMSEFNANIIMDNRVFFQSIYVTMHNPFDDPLFFRTHSYIKNISGDNDGLVSNKSASWGNNTFKLPDSISHEQIIGHGKPKNPGLDIPEIYLDIIKDLSSRGF